jgi:anti-anti-sigma regulatory factor
VLSAGGSLACCCLTPVVAKTFYIMRLTGATTIYDTEVEAVEAMK